MVKCYFMAGFITGLLTGIGTYPESWISYDTQTPLVKVKITLSR